MKSALIIGASRGIGRQISLTLAANGYQVGVASKTETSTAALPGSIHSVVEEIKSRGGSAIPIRCDARNEEDIRGAVYACTKQFGKIDLAVYNAGAILWKKVIETPLKRYDLMNSVNMRGSYVMVQEVLPKMLERKCGKIILVSPPIYNRFFKGKTPYAVTKVGMTVLVHGLANELTDTGVSVSALWPTSAIKSFVTEKMNTPDEVMYTSEIFADAVLKIAEEPSQKLNGMALLDEDYLRSEGVSDFTKYRCNPACAPPRMMPKKIPSLLVDEELETTFPKL
ncbi:hypothetical protein FSP39_009815 [Pinctada imbricata]|uniref:Hydroxysteroid dehydrogenase-like protein 2 n=1 Tax=Pinctada imbricata TaxID=66713 RepID=A0AA88XHR2_PINIB|nr:hypothetical protein FSP39_009815 [Pinctada imbricata]